MIKRNELDLLNPNWEIMLLFMESKKRRTPLTLIAFFLLIFISISTSYYPYWIEKNYNTNNYEKIWIKTNITNGEDLSLYVYYGGTSTMSNGYSVFYIFDDFTENYTIGDLDGQNGWIDRVGRSGYFVKDYGDNTQYVSMEATNKTYGPAYKKDYGKNTINYMFEIYFYYNSNMGNNFNFYTLGEAGNQPIYIRHSTTDIAWYDGAYNVFETNPTFDTWNWLGFVQRGQGVNQVDYFYNRILKDTGNTWQNDNVVGWDITAPNDPKLSKFKYVIGRQYSQMNPTITYGTEETGSWSFNGQTYTKRRQVTITNINETRTNYELWIDASYFSDINMFIDDAPAIPPISYTKLSPQENETTNPITFKLQITSNDTIVFCKLNLSGTIYDMNLINSTLCEYSLSLTTGNYTYNFYGNTTYNPTGEERSFTTQQYTLQKTSGGDFLANKECEFIIIENTTNMVYSPTQNAGLFLDNPANITPSPISSNDVELIGDDSINSTLRGTYSYFYFLEKNTGYTINTTSSGYLLGCVAKINLPANKTIYEHNLTQYTLTYSNNLVDYNNYSFSYIYETQTNFTKEFIFTNPEYNTNYTINLTIKDAISIPPITDSLENITSANNINVFKPVVFYKNENDYLFRYSNEPNYLNLSTRNFFVNPQMLKPLNTTNTDIFYAIIDNKTIKENYTAEIHGYYKDCNFQEINTISQPYTFYDRCFINPSTNTNLEGITLNLSLTKMGNTNLFAFNSYIDTGGYTSQTEYCFYSIGNCDFSYQPLTQNTTLTFKLNDETITTTPEPLKAYYEEIKDYYDFELPSYINTFAIFVIKPYEFAYGYRYPIRLHKNSPYSFFFKPQKSIYYAEMIIYKDIQTNALISKEATYFYGVRINQTYITYGNITLNSSKVSYSQENKSEVQNPAFFVKTYYKITEDYYNPVFISSDFLKEYFTNKYYYPPDTIEVYVPLSFVETSIPSKFSKFVVYSYPTTEKKLIASTEDTTLDKRLYLPNNRLYYKGFNTDLGLWEEGIAYLDCTYTPCTISTTPLNYDTNSTLYNLTKFDFTFRCGEIDNPSNITSICEATGITPAILNITYYTSNNTLIPNCSKEVNSTGILLSCDLNKSLYIARIFVNGEQAFYYVGGRQQDLLLAFPVFFFFLGLIFFSLIYASRNYYLSLGIFIAIIGLFAALYFSLNVLNVIIYLTIIYFILLTIVSLKRSQN